jgi:hypothetical protein
MQTFLPYESFHESVKALDNKRLGKQRVECLQIWKALKGESKGWRNHPATMMWSGHEYWLWIYWHNCIFEWKARGFKNSIVMPPEDHSSRHAYPTWLGNERFHASHRSNLLRKDPVHYWQFDWKEGPDMPYYWPVTKADLEVKKVLEFCS